MITYTPTTTMTITMPIKSLIPFTSSIVLPRLER